MFRVLVVLALLSCPFGLPMGKQHAVRNHGQKIVGGQETTIEEHPFQVYLSISNGTEYFSCGGSIISDYWILTAAHCMKDAKTIMILAGSSNLISGGEIYDSTNYTVHPKYNRKTRDYDIAVVYIADGMELDNTTMKAVTLATSRTSTAAGTMATVSGWGTTKFNGTESLELRSVQVPIVDAATCSRNYGVIRKKITANMLCAGYTKGLKDACQGDSGGPLVLDSGEQVGVTSVGNGCAKPMYPGIYAKVASLRSWIQKATGV